MSLTARVVLKTTGILRHGLKPRYPTGIRKRLVVLFGEPIEALGFDFGFGHARGLLCGHVLKYTRNSVRVERGSVTEGPVMGG